MIERPESLLESTVFFNFGQFFDDTRYNKEYYSSDKVMNSVQYPFYEYCDEEVVGKIFLCMAASHWNDVQFYKIINWFLDTLSNTKQISNNLHLSIAEVTVDTAIKFAFFAQKFQANSDCFKDLSRINHILKYIIDNNDDIETIRRDNAQVNGTESNAYGYIKKIVMIVPVYFWRYQMDVFWTRYKEFVLYLLFGDYKATKITTNILKEKYMYYTIKMLHECLSTNDVSILKGFYDTYNYNYIDQFKKCLNYLERLFIQSIEIGTCSYETYCKSMNKEYATMLQKKFILDDTAPFHKELVDVIVLALDLAENEDCCKAMFSLR